MEIRFNEEEIRREIQNKPSGVYELRILMTDFYNTKLSAYFDKESPDEVIEQMMRWRYPARCCINWYLTINPVKEYCRSREQFNDLRKCRVMTTDDDVERLAWLALDVDAKHPAGTSATDAEKAAALEQAREVYKYMDGCGFHRPEIVDSGNGYHLKYPVDLPNDDESRKFIASVVDALHERFPFIDKSVKNPSRILKLPGTLAMKGRNTEERPFRFSRIIQDAGRDERMVDDAEQ